jgi:isopenicillin N synthase-like dioxygenase
MPPSASPNPVLDEVKSMEDIEWADLVTLDLSKFDLPGGKQELASQVINAARTSGFFSVKNYGISNEDIELQRKLSQAFFDLPLEKKAPVL